MADGGDLPAAIAQLDGALKVGACAETLGLRGCLHLANADTHRGVTDLRAALYLAPSNAWLRYQYALGLHALGRDRAARSQVTAALDALAESDDGQVLDDEEINAGALRRAAREFLQRLP